MSASRETIVFVSHPDGTMETLWTEKINLFKFGKLKVKKASDVLFDVKKQAWYLKLGARTVRDGNGAKKAPALRLKKFYKSREEAIKAEIRYINARLKKGTLSFWGKVGKKHGKVQGRA